MVHIYTVICDVKYVFMLVPPAPEHKRKKKIVLGNIWASVWFLSVPRERVVAIYQIVSYKHCLRILSKICCNPLMGKKSKRKVVKQFLSLEMHVL